MPVDQPPRPFGWAASEEDRSTDEPQPVPVLHVGEVHADLVLHVTKETLTGLGTQIANMLADAARQGFVAGLRAGMADVDEEGAGGDPQLSDGGDLPPGSRHVYNPGPAEPVLTDEDLRRARGE